MAVQQLFQNQSLQKALTNYVRTLRENFDKVQGEEARPMLEKMLNANVEKYLASPNAFEFRNACFDGNGKRSPMSAKLGQPGSPICVDAAEFRRIYPNLAGEELVKRLGAMAMHEHCHHFQDAQMNSAESELECDKVEAYVHNTAATVTAISLKWDPAANATEQLRATALFCEESLKIPRVREYFANPERIAKDKSRYEDIYHDMSLVGAYQHELGRMEAELVRNSMLAAAKAVSQRNEAAFAEIKKELINRGSLEDFSPLFRKKILHDFPNAKIDATPSVTTYSIKPSDFLKRFKGSEFKIVGKEQSSVAEWSITLSEYHSPTASGSPGVLPFAQPKKGIPRDEIRQLWDILKSELTLYSFYVDCQETQEKLIKSKASGRQGQAPVTEKTPQQAIGK